jgi:hypothetical protein
MKVFGTVMIVVAVILLFTAAYFWNKVNKE